MRVRNFLEWPFFEPAHRELAERLDAWAESRIARRTHADDRVSVDAACRALVIELGSAGWTRYSARADAQFDVRALALIRDHINLQGTNPLVGPNDDRFGVRFPDMTQAYAREYRGLAQEEAGKLGMTLHEGVYSALLGPSYETPAEIKYLRTIGADLVGMSTVFEVIAARHMGIKVLAISCVTNMAAGILDQPLSHQEVMETGDRVKTSFEALLRAVLPRIQSDPDIAK